MKHALYCSKICSYAQGMAMLAAANAPKPPEGQGDRRRQFGMDYGMNLGDLARIWRAGCIIRAAFLDDITKAFQANPKLANLLLADKFKDAIVQEPGRVAPRGRDRRSSRASPPRRSRASLAYYDAYRRGRLPGNLIQAPARLLRRPHLRRAPTSPASSTTSGRKAARRRKSWKARAGRSKPARCSRQDDHTLAQPNGTKGAGWICPALLHLFVSVFGDVASHLSIRMSSL